MCHFNVTSSRVLAVPVVPVAAGGHCALLASTSDDLPGVQQSMTDQSFTVAGQYFVSDSNISWPSVNEVKLGFSENHFRASLF